MSEFVINFAENILNMSEKSKSNKKEPPSWLFPSKKSNSKAIKVSSPDEAKMILQSYVLTTAKYDFSVYEKRILYYCVKEAQKYLQGLKLDRNISIETIMKEPAKEITMPISDVLIGEDDKNHHQVKTALYSLLDKKIVYEDRKVWTAFTMIQQPSISKTGETATFTVTPLLWQCILDFSKGFHPYELQAAMRFTSVYSMRFYEYVSNPQKGFEPEIQIDTIKGWFGLEDKYSDNTDFIKRVIKPAQKDLDKSAPWSFDFEPIKEGRKYTKIKIIPRACPQNGDHELQTRVLERRTNVSWDIPDREVRTYLKEVIGFSDAELKNNRATWKDASIYLGDELRSILQDKFIAGRTLERQGLLHTTVKAYVVGSIKKIVEAILQERDNQINSIANDLSKSMKVD